MAYPDLGNGVRPMPGASAGDASAVTKSDTTVLPGVTQGLYVGTTGNVAVTMISGDNVTFPNVPAGAILPVRVSKVLSTGTTASDIVALY